MTETDESMEKLQKAMKDLERETLRLIAAADQLRKAPKGQRPNRQRFAAAPRKGKRRRR